MILVPNAGSSSLKFGPFEVSPGGEPTQRLEGQIDGIGTRPRFTAKGVQDEVLKDHVEHCVEGAIASGDGADQRRKVQELLTVLTRRDR